MPQSPITELPSFPSFNPSQTAGKPIKCKGWVAERGNSSWSPKNVALKEVVVPVPGPQQVRVRIYAAGVNPADAKRTSYVPPPSAGSSSGKKFNRHPMPPFEFPWVCGIEGSGVVESVGWDATSADVGSKFGLSPGDRVFFLADFSKGSGGSFCQYATVDADVVTKIVGPTSPVDGRMLDFVEAASFPVAAATAYVALFDKLRIEGGRSIFISGASGGLGTFAVQLAHFFGLYVFASCSTPNVSYVESLGANVVLDYTTTDVVSEILKQTGGCGVDYVLEAASASLAEEHAEALRFGGGICVVTGLVFPASDILFLRQASVHYVFTGMFPQHPVARPQLRVIANHVQQLYLQGAFNIFAEEVPFERATAALDVISQGHTRGKLVLTNFHPEEATAEQERRRKVMLLRSREAL